MPTNHMSSLSLDYEHRGVLPVSLLQILDEIDEHGIKIYHLPDAESDEDEEFKEQTRILKVQNFFSALLTNMVYSLAAV